MDPRPPSSLTRDVGRSTVRLDRFGRGAAWIHDQPGPLVAAVIAIAYFALAQYVIWLNDPVNAGAGYWPAAGVTLAALLLLPTRRWLWVAAGVAIAEIGGDLLHHYPPGATAWWAAGNVAGPLVGAGLLRRMGGGGRLAPLQQLGPFLVLGVVAGPLVSAVIGSTGTPQAFGYAQADVLIRWWTGDALGALVVAPLLLCFRERPVEGRSRLEFGAIMAAVTIVTLLAFRDWHVAWDVVLPYLVLPVLMLAAVRLGVRGAAMAGFVVAELANLATALGYGPFRLLGGSDEYAVTVLQVFLSASLVATLVIAVLAQGAQEHARRAESHGSVAHAFQVAALPVGFPTVPELAFAADYVAASTDDVRYVGGDWYDAFALPDASTAIVIGDVAGHGLEAAVMMGQVRNGMRSLFTVLDDPADVLAAIDRQLASAPELILVTAIVSVYRDGELRWANAGHPPLLIAPATGPSRYLTSAPNPPLGIGDGRYDTHRSPLEPGDVLLGYTDGVVEHRTRSLDHGFDRLRALLDGTDERDPQALCDLVLEQGLSGLPRDDDACVLAVRRDAASEAAPGDDTMRSERAPASVAGHPQGSGSAPGGR